MLEQHAKKSLYIGLMSGTSIDSIDAVLVDFSEKQPKTIAFESYPIDSDTQTRLHALCTCQTIALYELGQMDTLVGEYFAKAALDLLNKANISPKQIAAIGSHGQTIHHAPNAPYPFTLQIGNPSVIAARTGITTIANFRQNDIALSGQGAPLTPAFHRAFFQNDQQKQDRIILNIGGIANITILPKDKNKPILGFDTGPGNTLLDRWVHLHTQKSFDKDGVFAKQGCIQEALLSQLLQDPYFSKQAPKSTGREYFNLPWLETHLAAFKKPFRPADIQATLTQLTAQSIQQAILNYAPNGKLELFLCGGGAHNGLLIEKLSMLLPHANIEKTDRLGISVDAVEAMAFAFFAKKTLNNEPVDLTQITGASRPALTGWIIRTI